MILDDGIYLGHMLDFTEQAIGFVGDRSRDDFESDPVLRLATAHLIQNIGEAAGRVSKTVRHAHPEIDWRGIVGIRNVIVHDYVVIDYEAVWSVVKNDLPNLRDKLVAIVARDE